jgi:hypothetical protein
MRGMSMGTDMIHPAGRGREWNESFFFNLYDRSNDLLMFIRVGLMPNMDERSAFCFIMMPDGSVVWMKELGRFAEGGTAMKGLRLERVEADQRWRLTYSGHMDNMAEEGIQSIPVSFALDFETLNQPFNFQDSVHGERESVFEQVASDHVEQFGTAKGSLSMAERQYDINGMGERAHTWGVRDLNLPRMWIWLSAQFGPDLAFSVTKLFSEKEAAAGYFHLYGRNVAVVSADIHTLLDDDGTPRSMAISTTDINGGKHKATGEVLRVVMLPFPSRDGRKLTVMHEALVEFTFNGQKGYGMAEYLVRKN